LPLTPGFDDVVLGVYNGTSFPPRR